MNTRHLLRPAWRPLRFGLARVPRWLLATLLVALAAALPVMAKAAADDEDPPGRVGRLAQVDGEVQWYDSEQGAWEAAERNRPLTSGDRLSTGPGSRAELRVGSTVLRLAAATELEVRQLDDVRMLFELHSGSLALRVRSRELAREIELVTAEARLAPQRAGHYRLDRIDDSTQAGSWRGELRVMDDQGEGGFDIATGDHVELWREGRDGKSAGRLAHTRTPLPQDDFAAWVLRADQADTRSASTRYVSPEMTGVEDLDRHGRWDRHPEYGAVWFPRVVVADWAPYRHGRWQWTARWGWTWVDAAPWGFAPFHYGRWVHFGGRWAWAPGSYVRRPVFAPALVAWVGGPNFGVSVQIGGGAHPSYPHVGWVPLAPFEAYRPWYRASPGHVHHIDRHHPPRQQKPPQPRPGEPGRPTIPERIVQHPQQWANQRAPGGVTVVPRDALFRRDPVHRVVVDDPTRPGAAGRPWRVNETLPVQAPPARERPQAPAEGPAQTAPQRPIFSVGTERVERTERTERAEERRQEWRQERIDRRDAAVDAVSRPGFSSRPDLPRAVEAAPRPQPRPQPPAMPMARPMPPPPAAAAPAPPQPAVQPPQPRQPPPARAPLPSRPPAVAPAPPPAARDEAPRAGLASRERAGPGERARD